jgi:hypothetical protein
MDADELRGQGRDAIIKMAVERLYGSSSFDMSTFKLENFDMIRVRASRSSVRVSLAMSIQYIPMNSSYCYAVFVDLTENMISHGSRSNPEADSPPSGPTRFFDPDDGHRKAIAFVLDAIEKGGQDATRPMTIYERKDCFDVLIVTEYVEGGYRIDKRTGNVHDEWHDSLVPPPRSDDDEVFEEITE